MDMLKVKTPSAICAVSTEDEQVMLEICTGPKFLVHWLKSV
jgi:hypothetical protein